MKKERQPNPIAQKLGQALLEGAKEQFPTMTSLAEGINISKIMITHYSQGKTIPRPSTIGRYLEVVKPDDEALDKIMEPYGELLSLELVSLDVGVPSETAKTRMSVAAIRRWDNISERERYSEMNRKVNLNEERLSNIKNGALRRWEKVRREREMTPLQPEREFQIAS